MVDSPRVSVCIPTYNRYSYLKSALISALNQTYKNIEIVISDNCSTDNTHQVEADFKDPRINYHRSKKTSGPIENWNKSVALSSGEFITFLTDDDVLMPKYVEKLVKIIDSNKEISLARCGHEYIDEKGRHLGNSRKFPELETAGEFIYNRIRGKEPSSLPGYMFRKNDFLETGGFKNVGFDGGLFSDDYLWFRIALQRKYLNSTNQILWKWRKHQSNLGTGINIFKFQENIPNYKDSILLLLKEEQVEKPINYVKFNLSSKILIDRLYIEYLRSLNRGLNDSLSFIFRYLLLAIQQVIRYAYFSVAKLIDGIYSLFIRNISSFFNRISK